MKLSIRYTLYHNSNCFLERDNNNNILKYFSSLENNLHPQKNNRKSSVNLARQRKGKQLKCDPSFQETQCFVYFNI